jgi:hypothetical protein
MRPVADHEFTRQGMHGARFHEVDLGEASFEDVNLGGARFDNVNMSGVRIRGAWMQDVEISAGLSNVRINGVDVVPLIEAELDRRYPERLELRPEDAAGFRRAWTAIEQSWLPAVERARRLGPERLHERVDGEWSFTETMRHLVFATDGWVKRTILGDPAPYDPLDLPHTEMGRVDGVPNDPDARPALDDVLALRADRMATVRTYIDGLTDDALDRETDPNPAPGYPASGNYVVRDCLRTVLDEEWAHRIYAERDLAVLETRHVSH